MAEEVNRMKKKILVVDNHPVMLKFMTDLLRKEGHEVWTAEDGLSALDLLKTFTPDVIFTDLIMPRIGGEKLCQMVRRWPKLKDVYLVIFSAIAAEEKADFPQSEADACIAKGPFDRMEKNVREVLSQLDQKTEALQPKQVVGLDDVYPRQIMKELLSVKRHFEVTLKSMEEGIVEVTQDGRIVYANPAAVALAGLPEERLLSSPLIDIFCETDRPRIKDLFLSTNTFPQSVPEDSPVRLNGKEISLSFLPVVDEGAKTLILLLNDVSERRRIEAQLRQAQKMEAIATLAGGIAHDFNNLLMVIEGNASLMLFDLHPEHPNFGRLKSIEKQVQNGSRLTSQLLGYARKGRYEVKPISLDPLVKETSEVFGRTRKEITIHRNLAQDLSPIEADQGQIEQVLMNLLVNAADAMPGGGDLFLETANVTHEDLRGQVYQAKPGHYVLLAVKDTGIGMDQKTMERIFDPFFTTKELGRGTGLGLASVYGIVKGHGGYIDVESEQGKGATFKIYLPASSKDVQETVRTSDQIMRGTETILLVDDEAMVLETGQNLLKAMGYRTFTARSGEEALQVYETYRDSIDLVILDLVMPHQGGGEVFDRLKEMDREVKVLLSSGYCINGEAMKILDRGCRGFIQKPFDLMQFSQSLRTILDEKED
jgi:PAS domain S-box-containing protein